MLDFTSGHSGLRDHALSQYAEVVAVVVVVVAAAAE